MFYKTCHSKWINIISIIGEEEKTDGNSFVDNLFPHTVLVSMVMTAWLLEGHQSCLGLKSRGCTASSGWVRKREEEENRTWPQNQLADPNTDGPKRIIIKKDRKKKRARVMNRTLRTPWHDLQILEHRLMYTLWHTVCHSCCYKHMLEADFFTYLLWQPEVSNAIIIIALENKSIKHFVSFVWYELAIF